MAYSWPGGGGGWRGQQSSSSSQREDGGWHDLQAKNDPETPILLN